MIAPRCMALIATCLFVAAVSAAERSYVQVLDDMDFTRMQRLAEDPELSQVQRDLARANVLSMTHRDAEAAASLQRITASGAPAALVSRAMRTLSGVRIRQGRYGDAADLMTTILQMNGRDVAPMSPETRDFFAALRGVPPMIREGADAGAISVHHDKADLLRVPVRVHDRRIDGVIDTGAGFSTVTATEAARLGLRTLEGQVIVDGTTAQVESTLAVADSLRIADTVFRNVVFIVVPDRALTFPSADYRIELILGLPVILELGRIQVDEGSRLTFDSSTRAPATEPNLLLSGWQTFVLAHSGSFEEPLRLMLDTGARRSQLMQRARVDFPGLIRVNRAEHRARAGAGGEVSEEVEVVSRLSIELGGAASVLRDLSMLADDGTNRHGVLGQDALHRRQRVVLDFEAMRIELTECSGT